MPAPLLLAQIGSAGIPMTAAALFVGGWYHTIFAFGLVPFFASRKFISDRLRRILLDAVTASRDVRLLVGRFDRIPQHAAWVLHDHVVCNRRPRKL